MTHLESSPRNNGFTLIETLIYVAIASAMLSFALATTYQLINASDRGENQKEVVENQKLLEQKIYWALQNVSTINSPAVGPTTTSLSVDKIGFANNPVVIYTDNEVVKLKQGSGAALPITNDAYTAVRNLTFHQFDFSGHPAIKANATIFNAFASTSLSSDIIIFIK